VPVVFRCFSGVSGVQDVTLEDIDRSKYRGPVGHSGVNRSTVSSMSNTLGCLTQGAWSLPAPATAKIGHLSLWGKASGGVDYRVYAATLTSKHRDGSG